MSADLRGLHFGKWTVLRPAVMRAGNGHHLWWCRCACKRTTTTVQDTNLTRGGSRQCRKCKADDSTMRAAAKRGDLSTHPRQSKGSSRIPTASRSNRSGPNSAPTNS